MEIWKDIKGYEGLYQVSNLGRVKGLDRYVKNNHSVRYVKERILKPNKNKDGYFTISFWVNGKMKQYYVHRLVAEAFLDNPNNYPIVNHRDETSSNNNSSNLEWCSYKYNNDYGTRKIRSMISQGKKVLQYDLQDNLIKEWNSTREIERELKIHHSLISNCCRGKREMIKNNKWKYKDIA